MKDMYKGIASDNIELMAFNENARLMMQFKLSAGKEMADFRTWVKWHEDQEYHPKRENSMMIEKRLLRPVIAKILEVLDAQEGKQS